MGNDKLKNTISYILTALVALVIIIYLVIKFAGSFGGGIKTTTSILTTERELTSCDSYIIKQESIIYTDIDGSIRYTVKNGTKVAGGGYVATIYSGVGKELSDRIVELDDKITILKNSLVSENTVTSDTQTLDNKINTLFANISSSLNGGNVSYALANKDEYLSLLNKKGTMMGNGVDYNEVIETLRAEKKRLIEDNSIKTDYISSPVAGYFFNEIDGYETVYSSVNVDTLTIDGFRKLIKNEPDYSLKEKEDSVAIGKISPGYAWYIATELPYSIGHNFSVGKEYDIIFTESSNTEIKATLYRIVTEPGSDRCILVFKNGYILEGFNYLRHQTVQVVSSSYTGYRVPISAVREVDGVKGVYILKGSEVIFREINPLFEKNGFLIVEARDPRNTAHQNRLDVNEFIIVDNGEYYDGMLVSK